MKSYSLDNWDGKHSNSEQKTTQNNPMGSSRTWENRSNKPASSSENVKTTNDASKAGTKLSESIGNQAASEVSSNFANELSNGLQREHLSQNMGFSFFMNTGSPVLTGPITPRKENASNDGPSGTCAFLPADSPLLRAFHTFNASTSSADLAERLEAAISGSPLPRANKNADVISLHSTDAEGEDEDETDDVIVAETLLSFSPSKPETHTHEAVRSPSPSEHNSLFTPPPSEGYLSADHLFTPPPPSRKPVPASKPNLVMSHVQVPRCPGPKSAYKWLLPHSTEKKKKATKSQVSSSPVRVHRTLEDALQFAWNHNDSVGVLPYRNTQGKKKKEKKEKKKDTYQKPRNAIAGPSKPYISLGSASTAGKAHINEKKRVHDGESNELKKKQKTNHVDIDLTLTDDEQRDAIKSRPKPPRPKPNPLLKRIDPNDEDLDLHPLVLGVVKPLDPQILSLNTRILQQDLRKFEPSYPSSTSNEQIQAKRRKKLGKGLLPWAQRTSYQSESDEISIGGPIHTSWDPGYNPSDDDDEPDFVQPTRFEPLLPPPPLPTPATNSQNTSRKIDLAALYRQKEKSRVKANHVKSSKSPNQSKLPATNAVPSSSVGLATPSHSVYGSLSDNSSVVFNDEDEQRNSVIVTTPSAKALGKRRAISPPLLHTSHHPEKTHDSTHPGLNGNRDPDIFIHNYIPSSPPFETTTNTFASGLTLSSSFSPKASPGILPPHQLEPSHDVDPVTELFDVQAEQLHFWSSLESGVSEEYQYSTIDPAVLGGALMDQEPSELDYTAGLEQSDHDFENMFDGSECSDDDSDLEESGPVAGSSGIRQLPSLRSSPSTTSFSRKEYVSSVTSASNPPKRKERSASISTSSIVSPEIVPAISTIPALQSDSPPVRKKKLSSSALEPDRLGSEYIPSTPSLGRSTTVRRKPRRASLTSSYGVDVLSEKEYASSNTSNFEPAPSGKGKQRELSMEIVRTLPKRQRTQRQKPDMLDIDVYLKSAGSKIVKDLKVPPVIPSTVPSATKKEKSSGTIKGTQEWPTCDTSSYCHQCRNKSNLLKMVCSSCSAAFCGRCIALRYPDVVEFVEDTDACPRCEKYCNCTGCCNRRGEQYISSRRPPGKCVQPPKVMPEDAEYFGTVYDLNGKRIAVTYAPSGEEGNVPKVVFAQGTGNQPSTTKTEKRLFVGMVQKCWGLGKYATIKEIRPMARPKKAKKNTVLRTFVGRPDFVKYPTPPKPEEDYDDYYDDDLSSLTSLTTSDDEQEGLGPDVEIFTPGSLGDNDVVRAITLALNACGLIIATDGGPTYSLLSSL